MGPSFFGPHYIVNSKISDLGLIHQPDQIDITSMRWIYPPCGVSSSCCVKQSSCYQPSQPILAVSKPGRLLLFSFLSDSVGWSGSRVLLLRNQKIHKSSSAFHPAVGLNYFLHQDILIVTLTDGSFHVVQNISSDPSWSSGHVNSYQISKAVRSAFVESWNFDVDLADMNRITGVCLFDDRSTVIWAQEWVTKYSFSFLQSFDSWRAMRPSDFSYKHEAQNHSCLVIAQLWEDVEDSDEALLKDLTQLFHHARGCEFWKWLEKYGLTWVQGRGRHTLDLLHPNLSRFRDKAKLNELHPRILEALCPSPGDHSLMVNITPCSFSLTTEVRQKFRVCLSRHLFGYDALESLRVQLALADFTWVGL